LNPKQFKPSPSAQIPFTRALRRVAKASGHIVETHVDGHEIKNTVQMTKALTDYSKLLTPWATRQSSKMLAQVMKSNRRVYTNNSKAVGLALRLNVAESEVGRAASVLMAEQVALITSIPIEAGKRAQKLALEAIYDGTRASEIAEELMRTTSVTESRAILIARTETARANSVITQSRAIAVGSKGYYWRTSMDGAERESHAKMNGKYVAYDKPPTLIDGTTGHAGTFPNCRCWQDVQFDDV
jgi:SPP1 gp7 family putative phage head morphogenesis protein